MHDSVHTYRMVGRNVRVEFDDSLGGSILRDELSVYPPGDDAAAADLRIRYRPLEFSGRARVNPRLHEEFDDGFIMHSQTADIRFYVEDSTVLGADFYPAGSSSGVVASLRKAADMQFSSREERSGVVFHELVLVPAVHWMTDVAIVHASAFSNRDGDVTLIGGTGGVGKTSLALELCLNHGYAFVADDITFVGDDGRVWPNLAYPKIYGYNLEDNAELAERVLAGRGWADRLHWGMHRRRGLSYVRRRIHPGELYDAFSNSGGPLRRYVILVREDRQDIDAVRIDEGRAAELSISLMPAEYYPFYNHLHWHRFNRLVDGKGASIAVEQVLTRWEQLLGAVLASAECLMVRIPTAIDHRVFKQEMGRLLTTTP